MRVALLLVLLVAFISAHSWLDCTDWRFNNPNVQRFNDTYGTCVGYPRRYPATRLAYGTYDGYRYYRHYDQDPNRVAADDAPPCSQFNRVGQDGVTLVGSDERKGNPVTVAYAPNKDPDQFNLGAITTVTVGQQLCWRWPAKNHAGHVNDQNMVFVNWATTPNSADPTQRELNTMQVATMRFRNCPDPGVPASSDQTGVGSDRMACGGCFNVPQRSPGTYLVQWRWQLNAGEWYASCSDIQVTAGPTNQQTGQQTSQQQITSRQTSAQNTRQTQQTNQQTNQQTGQQTDPQTQPSGCNRPTYCTDVCGEGNVDSCTCQNGEYSVTCVTGDANVLTFGIFALFALFFAF